MDWIELKEEAKKMGYKIVKKAPYGIEIEAYVNKKGYAFYRDGTVEFDCDMDNNLCGIPITNNRTISKMFAIMKALQ